MEKKAKMSPVFQNKAKTFINSYQFYYFRNKNILLDNNFS